MSDYIMYSFMGLYIWILHIPKITLGYVLSLYSIFYYENLINLTYGNPHCEQAMKFADLMYYNNNNNN
jgi:hypothetical protein